MYPISQTNTSKVIPNTEETNGGVSEGEIGMDGPPGGHLCSACHGNLDPLCQANCSHWFCGNCIMRVWHHGSEVRPCTCPLCRRPITLLVPSRASSRQVDRPEVAEILSRVERHNHVFGGRSRSLLQGAQDLPFLLRRLLRELIDPDRSLPLVIRARVWIAMIMGAAYLFSPFDFIPEAIFGIAGLLDDFFIVLIVFFYVAAIYRSVLYRRHGGS